MQEYLVKRAFKGRRLLEPFRYKKNVIVWIWMGPPDEANEEAIFRLEEFDNTG